MAPIAITEEEADGLGAAWAAYIESVPGRKKKAIGELVGRIFPVLVAAGTTFAVFGPRVRYIYEHSGRPQPPPRRQDDGGAARANPNGPGTTSPPSAWRTVEQVVEPPAGDGEVKPDRRNRVDIGDDL